VLVEGKMKDDKLMVEYIDVPGAAVKENQPYIPPPLVCDSMSYEETITVRVCFNVLYLHLMYEVLTVARCLLLCRGRWVTEVTRAWLWCSPISEWTTPLP
jgi:hypothetical protein